MAMNDVVGHERPLKILQGMLRSGRIPHSMLFRGEDGIGKKFTAINFFKALNCENKEDGIDACDSCRVCRLISNLTHPDMKIISPENGQIKVDTIRELNEFLSLKPYEKGYRMVIVDNAHTLNISASNAFLKTIEEPPEKTIIILISSRPESMPKTILSRCVNILFSPLSKEDSSIIQKRLNPSSDEIRLFTGRPGLYEKDSIKVYINDLKTLREILYNDGYTSLRIGGIELQRIIDLSIVYLRDIMVQALMDSGQMASSDNSISSKFMILNELNPSEDARIQKIASLESIIGCYRKIINLKKTMVYNPNQNITVNYLSSILKKV